MGLNCFGFLSVDLEFKVFVQWKNRVRITRLEHLFIKKARYILLTLFSLN